MKLSIVLCFLLSSCTWLTGTRRADTRQRVVAGYADVAWLSYQNALTRTRVLQNSIEAFLTKPSAPGLMAAQSRWLEARWAYGQTEVFRFYGGPIDDARGLENRINPWPVDESYVDYLIADPTQALDPVSLGAAHSGEKPPKGVKERPSGQKSVTLGWHAIEYLLWGQDQNTDGPGQRLWQDFAGPAGTRRAQFLRSAMLSLLADITTVATDWDPDVAGNYRATWLAMRAAEAFPKMLTGMAVLAKSETGGERMDVALDTQDQGDEPSCFSDNSHNDAWANWQGILNVWQAHYGAYQGESLRDLLQQEDPKQFAVAEVVMMKTARMMQDFPIPFDQSIRVKDAPSWKNINSIVHQLYAVSDMLVQSGTHLGVTAVARNADP